MSTVPAADTRPVPPGTTTAPGPDTLPALLTRTALRQPDAPALITPGRVLAYRELDAVVAGMAAVLRERGIGRGDRVAVLADRTWQGVAAPLAVLRAGAAYVPLDPADPAERLRAVTARTAPAAVLGRPDLLHALPPGLGVPPVPAEAPARPAPPPDPAGTGPEADDLAYAMLTSGSTGTPKAVLVPHRALAASASALVGLFGLTPADRVLHWTSLIWDTSGEEIHPALLAGAALVVDERVEERSVPMLLALLREHRISVVDLPTAMWTELVDHLATGHEPLPPGLRLVVTGGEAVPARAVRRWSEAVPDRVRLLNTYGQTETVMITHAAEIGGPAGRALRDGDPVPIGRPLPHVRQVLDAHAGQPAELWTGGPTLAWGYAGDAARTAAAFGPAPDEPGGRYYRTGDLVRVLPDGSLAHAGRADRQLKVRGVRVEPAEIEAVVASCPGVAAAVVVTEDGGGHVRLVAAYVPSGAEPAGERSVAAHCARLLPKGLLPHRVVALPALPLLPTGKVDRRALRELCSPPPRPSPAAVPAAAGTASARARRMAGLCTRSLGAPCGIDDSLFALGGDSLTVTRLISLAHRELGAELTFQDVFDHPTPRELALLADGPRADGPREEHP